MVDLSAAERGGVHEHSNIFLCHTVQHDLKLHNRPRNFHFQILGYQISLVLADLDAKVESLAFVQYMEGVAEAVAEPAFHPIEDQNSFPTEVVGQK